MLKPQDIVVLAWLIARKSEPWRYVDLAQGLFISPSEAHSAMKRLSESGLIVPSVLENGRTRPNFRAVVEFLSNGVPYVYYANWGPESRGVPTGIGAPPLDQFYSPGADIPVWPDPDGEARGPGLEPLYKSVPRAARSNPELYELLALIDALRCGRSRERNKAEELLKEKLANYASSHSSI